MAHGCTVDAGAGSLRIGAEDIFLHKTLSSELARCYRVAAVEDTLILPQGEAIVSAKIMGNPLCEPWGTVGPSLPRRPVGSVGRAPGSRTGGRGFKPRPDQHSGSLNN